VFPTVYAAGPGETTADSFRNIRGEFRQVFDVTLLVEALGRHFELRVKRGPVLFFDRTCRMSSEG